MIRFLDILFSVLGLLILSPVFLMIMLIIPFDSKGGVFFIQTRVGNNNRDFRLIKFRTMRSGAEGAGGLTIGARDSRITRMGYWLRRFKLDELPQLINIVKGDMSFVGPRPELRKYVDLYTPEQRKVLQIKPGLTDWASIEYFHENDILGKSASPEEAYIHTVMPVKISLNMKFIEKPSVCNYLRILGRTVTKVLIKS